MTKGEYLMIPLLGGPLDGQTVEDKGRIVGHASQPHHIGQHFALEPTDGSKLIAYLYPSNRGFKGKAIYRREGDKYIFVEELENEREPK